MQRAVLWLLAGALSAALPACKSETIVSIGIADVYQSDHCGIQASSVELVSDASLWRSITRGAQRFVDQTADAEAEDRFRTLAQRAHVVLLAAGSKPSAGYGIRVGSEQARLVDGALIVAVESIAPPPDSLQAAVMTSPCVVIAIPRDERVEQLRFTGLGQPYLLDVSR